MRAGQVSWPLELAAWAAVAGHQFNSHSIVPHLAHSIVFASRAAAAVIGQTRLIVVLPPISAGLDLYRCTRAAGANKVPRADCGELAAAASLSCFRRAAATRVAGRFEWGARSQTARGIRRPAREPFWPAGRCHPGPFAWEAGAFEARERRRLKSGPWRERGGEEGR